MGKGVAVVLLVAVVLAVVGVGVVAAARAATRSLHRRAIRGARWRASAKVQGNGVVEVGVELVAEEIGGPEVLRFEHVTSVNVTDPGSPTLLEAQSTAELRAATYNSFARGSP